MDQLRLRQPDVPRLIPVRFDDCLMPDVDLGGGRTLGSIQRADLFGERREEGMKRLVTSVQRLLGQRSPGQSTGAKKAFSAPPVTPRIRPSVRTARQADVRDPGGSIPLWRAAESAALVEAAMADKTPAFTDRWRTARGHDSSAAMRSTERIFDHIAYRTGAAQPPAFLIGVILPCWSLGDSQPGPDGMRQRFGLFLARRAFMDLITEAGEIGPGCSWRPMAGRGRILLESHLCASTRVSEQFPVASVKLILPDQDVATYGSDSGQADLLVRINLPPHKTALPQWRERFARALELPGHLATFLTRDLKLPITGRAAEACLRIVARQESPTGLHEVVNVSMFEALPASHVPNEFRECRVADQDGNEITTVARKLARNLAEALHVTGYEQALDVS